MTKKIKVALLALAMTAGLASFGPGAEASGPGDCPSTKLCVWQNANYVDPRYQFGGNNSSWHFYAIADEDSSWYNNGASGARVQVYKNTGYITASVCIGYKQAISNNSFAHYQGSSNKRSGC